MPTASRIWIVRVSVLGAFVLTLVLAGPRAWHVLAHRAQSAVGPGPTADVERVGFRGKPEWLGAPLLLAVLQDLEPRLRGQVGLLDDAGALALRERVEGSPWVASADFRRAFPDRLVASVQLRRPVLRVSHEGVGSAEALVDAEGIVLPAVTGVVLPRTAIAGAPAVAATIGKAHPDRHVRAAASVAAEWRDALMPLVPDAPLLIEVDATNLDYQFVADPQASEIRVGLQRRDGGVAYFAYDHPPGASAPRVSIATKAAVLRSILGEFPGLDGLVGGDLRLINRWRHFLVPRVAAEPR